MVNKSMPIFIWVVLKDTPNQVYSLNCFKHQRWKTKQTKQKTSPKMAMGSNLESRRKYTNDNPYSSYNKHIAVHVASIDF